MAHTVAWVMELCRRHVVRWVRLLKPRCVKTFGSRRRFSPFWPRFSVALLQWLFIGHQDDIAHGQIKVMSAAADFKVSSKVVCICRFHAWSASPHHLLTGSLTGVGPAGQEEVTGVFSVAASFKGGQDKKCLPRQSAEGTRHGQ